MLLYCWIDEEKSATRSIIESEIKQLHCNKRNRSISAGNNCFKVML